LAAIVGEAVPSSGAAALRRWHEELCIRRAQIEEARQATSTERARHPTALDPLPLILDHRLRRVTADVEFLEKLRAEYEKSAGLPSLSTSPPRASCGRKGVDVERPLTPSRPREAADRVTDTKLRAASPGCHQPRGRPSRSR